MSLVFLFRLFCVYFTHNSMGVFAHITIYFLLFLLFSFCSVHNYFNLVGFIVSFPDHHSFIHGSRYRMNNNILLSVYFSTSILILLTINLFCYFLFSIKLINRNMDVKKKISSQSIEIRKK